MFPYNIPSLNLFRGCAQDFRLRPRRCAVNSGHARELKRPAQKSGIHLTAEYIFRRQGEQGKK